MRGRGDPRRLGLRLLAHLLDDRDTLLAGLLAERASLVAGLGELGAWYCLQRPLASACASSARSMPPSMASVRSSSVFLMFGKANFASRKKTTANAMSPMISSSKGSPKTLGLLPSLAKISTVGP